MANHILSKSTFIRAKQCTKSLYLNKFHKELRDRISPEQLAIFRRGTNVGILARDLFPGGIDMSPKSPSQYQKKVAETAAAMLDHSVTVIYEAVFQYNDVLIMLDILVRNGDGWNAYEVKSSLKISETYVTDAALQYYVLLGSGINIIDFQLVYINSEYIFNGELDLNELFTSISVIDTVKAKISEIETEVHQFKQVLSANKIPEIAIGTQCENPYPCDFKGFCWKNIPTKSILKLTSFSEEQLFDFVKNGIYLPSQIPFDFIQTELQQIQIQSINTNTSFWNKEIIKQYLSPITEQKTAFIKTVIHQPAVPAINGTKPYQQVLLAISISSSENTTKTFFIGDEISQKGNLKNVFDFLSQFNHLVTFNAFNLLQLIYLQQDISIRNSISERILDLNEILEKADFFHPSISKPQNLNDLNKILLSSYSNLKNESYLISDLLITPNGSTSLKFSLEQYSLALKQLSNYFIFEK